MSLQPPDDGKRRSDVRLWDEASRPTGPASDPDRRYTAHERGGFQSYE
jgi:hypothetical protein